MKFGDAGPTCFLHLLPLLDCCCFVVLLVRLEAKLLKFLLLVKITEIPSENIKTNRAYCLSKSLTIRQRFDAWHLADSRSIDLVVDGRLSATRRNGRSRPSARQ